MPDETKNELLINALLDDQLDATEAQRARQQIANDKDLSEMLASFEEQRVAISDLPKFQLDDDFAYGIVEIGAAEVAAVPTMNRPAAPVSKVDWKRYAMSLAAIAALLMGMLVYQWTPGGQETAVLTPAANAIGTSSIGDDDPVAVRNRATMKKSPGSSPALAIVDESDGSMDDAAPMSDVVAASPTFSPAPTGTQPRSPKMQSVAEKDYALNESPGERFYEAEDSDAAKPDETNSFALRGTAMAAPEPQSQPPIDQVWLMEVGESYSQNQLVTALTSNSISVPAELQTVASESDEAIPLGGLGGEVDGIQVAAKRSQMRRALSQLSQSDAVTISAFQLPNQADLNGVSNLSESRPFDQPTGGGLGGGAPTTIVAPSRAMAQRLRGNFFAPPSPSSKVPETYSQLEERMGVYDLTKSDDAAKSTAQESLEAAKPALAKDKALTLNNAKEMKELFPDGESDSESFSNFVIIIRNEAKPKK